MQPVRVYRACLLCLWVRSSMVRWQPVTLRPRSPLALLTGIKQAIALGAVTKKARDDAIDRFTLHTSVDDLLSVIDPYA